MSEQVDERERTEEMEHRILGNLSDPPAEDSFLDEKHRKYIERIRISGSSYAGLMATFFYGEHCMLTKDQIAERAQEFTTNKFIEMHPSVKERYSGWHEFIGQMEDRHHLIERIKSKGKHRFFLNETGKQFARTLLSERAREIERLDREGLDVHVARDLPKKDDSKTQPKKFYVGQTTLTSFFTVKKAVVTPEKPKAGPSIKNVGKRVPFDLLEKEPKKKRETGDVIVPVG